MKNLIALFCVSFLSVSALAAAVFPYTVRTKDYSGWTPASQSDTNTTGMGGATIALPASVSAAQSNPAGFAMETGSVSAQINRITVYDQRIQPDAINSSQWGLGISPPPWGFALTYYSPFTENDSYFSQNTGDAMNAEVSMKEFGLTVSRYFFDSQLAIGIKFELIKAVRELRSFTYDSYAPSFTLGALYRLPHHLMLGAGYTPPLTIGPNTDNTPQSELPGFNASVLRPSELDFGVGWVPNRFFKVGTQVSFIGDTSNTALLSDQSIATGSVATMVPRIGESYVIADYKNFKSEWAIGSYYDFSRLQGQGDRLHLTTGLDVNPWFINLGIGYDTASNYHNFMGGIGIDFVRFARFFKIIPEDSTPHYEGVFPQPGVISADGLPDAMTPGEKREAQNTTLGDVGTIIKEAPGNIVDKFTGKKTTVELKEEEKEKGKGTGGT